MDTQRQDDSLQSEEEQKKEKRSQRNNLRREILMMENDMGKNNRKIEAAEFEIRRLSKQKDEISAEIEDRKMEIKKMKDKSFSLEEQMHVLERKLKQL